MTIKINLLGCIKIYNGVDVTQSSDYIKISTHTYIDQIIKDKPWISSTLHTSPIPMISNNVYNHNLRQLEPLAGHDLKLVILDEDYQDTLLMENSGQPTKCTHHMNIKHFSLQQWVGQDLLLLKRVITVDNESDLLTKILPRTLFYQHNAYIMGKVVPAYIFNVYI